MDSLPLSADELKRLIGLFDEHRLLELELREGDVRVRLQAAQVRKPVAEEAEPEFITEEGADVPPVSQAIPPAAREPGPEEKGWIGIEAPMTGTFYRTASPGEPPFIELGSRIEPDQTIGIIEAMKIFSEIRSEIGGTVMEIPASSGQMVQPGQVLVWIQPG